MNEIKLINTSEAGNPLGHYSHATVHRGMVYVAGILGMSLADQSYIGSIAEQTEWALQHLQAILKAAHSDLAYLLSVTIFVTDLTNWQTINEIYGQFLAAHKPARAVVGVASLPRGFGLELMATAAIKE